MNREQAKAVVALFEAFPDATEVCDARRENLDVIKAFAAGKTVQNQTRHGWASCDDLAFSQPRQCYRIKPNTVKVVRYLNVYENGETGTFKRKEEADDAVFRKRIACVRIELDVEEGRFDD